METIKIAHLYYDLMNLYGETGNVLSLVHHLEKNNVKVITHFLTIDDEINFDKYDVFYIGSGNLENFLITREDIMKRKKQIKKAFQNNKFFIITGNALDLFGKQISLVDNTVFPTLQLLNYESFETDFRIVGDAVFKQKEIPESIIGFQNRFSVIKNMEENPLFTVINGTGSVPKSETEGIQKNNFYGTYLLGPLLIRNPYFTEILIKKILKSKNLPYQNISDSYELKAYQEYQKNIEEEKKGL